MSSSYRLELDKWLSQLDVKADRVLDIGGSQLPIKGRTKSWDVKEYLIADLPEPHVGSPKPDIEVDMNQGWASLQTFDLIFCLEVFDYIWSPSIAVQNIANSLSNNGIAWVTFPSFYPLHQPIEDDALRYMPGAIKKLVQASGLKIVEMVPRRAETDMLTRTWSAERMRAAKNEDHNITGWIVCLQK